jgi:hypothetical protein
VPDLHTRSSVDVVVKVVVFAEAVGIVGGRRTGGRSPIGRCTEGRRGGEGEEKREGGGGGSASTVLGFEICGGWVSLGYRFFF